MDDAQYHKDWEEKHKAERKEYWRTRYQAKKDELSAAARAYYADHADERRAYATKYHKEHPEVMRQHMNKRRAWIRGAFVEDVFLDVLIERDGTACGVCGLDVSRPDMSVDHIKPLSRGGKHSYANTQITHLVCNKRKNAREI